MIVGDEGGTLNDGCGGIAGKVLALDVDPGAVLVGAPPAGHCQLPGAPV